AAPHVIDYDALLLGLAAALVFARGLERGLRLTETLFLVLLWVSPFFNPPTVFRAGFATPLLILLCSVQTMKRRIKSGVAKPARNTVGGLKNGLTQSSTRKRVSVKRKPLSSPRAKTSAAASPSNSAS